ncbi:MAG: deoxyguanosinetriphosphate triphosphohydrolase [Clostridia bacterium]|nr:deoxyguanosinetriphosphate triphosphohydrolase [Clostridia bacterium]
MTIRERTEMFEEEILSPYASKSKYSKGRKKTEDLCDIRTCYQRDRDRIIHSKAFRRLMHKTQAFISPEGDHYRTRLTHTLEVSQVARTIATALRLNEDLTEAIALGHDLGHTPFGHLGEDDLNGVLPGGFHHNIQSIRVAERIEKNGEGLNLTKEVLDGMLNHRGAGSPSTLEGKIVQISDKIAYVNHDIDDAIRAGIITELDLPRDCVDILGNTSRKRIDFLIRNIIKNSENINDIRLDEEARNALYKLRKYMFDNVYNSGMLSEEREKYGKFLSVMYGYYLDNFKEVPEEFKKNYDNNTEEYHAERIVADYLAGMTDRFARNVYESLGDSLKKYL